MYEDYYRFRRQPFSPTPDPEFLYKSAIHQKALEELLRGVRRREGMLLLTGDVGTGKTTTTRALLGLLDRDVFTALVIDPFVTADELLRMLLQDFGVVSDSRLIQDIDRQTLVDTLNRFLLSLSSVGASALAVVDEAQNLKPAVLEQLRVLTTLETDQQKLLQILLVGQPELRTMLETPEMRPLNQRIARRCALSPLNRDEVESYVAFRIGMARGDREMMFSAGALELVYKFSGGVPRQINKICDRSLEAGFAVQSPTVEEALVVEAAEALELTQQPAVPISPAVPSSVGASPAVADEPRRVSSRTKRWLATAVGVAAGVGLGWWVTMVVPTESRTPNEASGAASIAAADPAVESGFIDDPAYRVIAGEFDTLAPAQALAERLRRLGGAVSVSAPAGTVGHYLVWVGPYATLTEARSMDIEIKGSFGLGGTRVVGGGLGANPPQ